MRSSQKYLKDLHKRYTSAGKKSDHSSSFHNKPKLSQRGGDELKEFELLEQ